MKFQHILALSALLLPIFSAPTSDPAPLSNREETNLHENHDIPYQHIDTKYFHEPGGGDDLGHYDKRYFKGESVSYEEKQETLKYLIISYLNFFRGQNLQTWLAHGTLLGWWWNGKIMPWDWDLDTQVSGATLVILGERFNMTLHNHTETKEDGTEIHREFLLDVNPNINERIRGDGMNVIDARWIDTSNGLFIDITGLSETNPGLQPGVLSCKNYHRYTLKDLYPMRPTEFEGVQALIPYSFDEILTTEYSTQALTKTLHEGHRWIPNRKEWVKQENLSEREKRQFETGWNPHVPRSLQEEDLEPGEEPRNGLGNLGRVF